jgi:hypothetical protein
MPLNASRLLRLTSFLSGQDRLTWSAALQRWQRLSEPKALYLRSKRLMREKFLVSKPLLLKWIHPVVHHFLMMHLIFHCFVCARFILQVMNNSFHYCKPGEAFQNVGYH